MIPRIKSCETIDNWKLKVDFDDGKKVVYDVLEDIESIPSYSVLREDSKLFENVRVDKSRTVVYWNDGVDLPSDAIYEYGVEIQK